MSGIPLPPEVKELTDEEREREANKRRRDQWALLLLLLFQTLRDDLHDIARQYGKGRLTAHEFGDEVYALLPIAHSQAAYYGRRLAGISGAFDEDDVRFGLHAAEEQEEFLQGFTDDLSRGRYLALNNATRQMLPNVKAIESRLTLYAMAVAGTANEAWTEAMPLDTLFDWRDVRDAAECPDCEKWALQGPYDRESLPAIPGDGTSQCKTNCRCELVIRGGPRDGETSFDLRHLFDGEALIDG